MSRQTPTEKVVVLALREPAPRSAAQRDVGVRSWSPAASSPRDHPCLKGLPKLRMLAQLFPRGGGERSLFVNGFAHRLGAR